MDDEFESPTLLREMIEEALKQWKDNDNPAYALEYLQTEYEKYDRECQSMAEQE